MSTQSSRSRARFKSVENRVAKYLTELLSYVGKSPIERIPILGRTGPDITSNELGMVIDVKSRLSIPEFMFAPANTELHYEEFVGFRLEDFLRDDNLQDRHYKISPIVRRWWEHMDEWKQKHSPDGITTIILHRSRMPIGHATVIISNEDRSKLCKRLFS